MKDVTHIGMDVHKESIAVAVLRPGRSDPDEFVIPNTPESIRKTVTRIGEANRLLACYEAGPTGFDTYRILGISSPSSIGSMGLIHHTRTLGGQRLQELARRRIRRRHGYPGVAPKPLDKDAGQRKNEPG